MSSPSFDLPAGALTKAAFDRRWVAMASSGVDLQTIATWDRMLPRTRRVLVPVDVQAYVVPAGGGEPVVAVSGGPEDPEPLQAGASGEPGVHLHWAMPDALVTGRHDTATGDLVLPELPDRFVVLRQLYPVGSRTVQLTGWVLDARSGTVAPLDGFTGTFTPAADARVLTPLDGTSGGSPSWTGTYTACRNRFALHDPLTDLPKLLDRAPDGFDGGRASYTVAGWWSDTTHDPLSDARGPDQLASVLAGLGWWVSPDVSDDLLAAPDPRTMRLHDQVGLDSPAEGRAVTTVRKYATSTTRDEDVAPVAGVPVENAAQTFVGVAPTRYLSMLHGSVLGVPVDGAAAGLDERPDASTFTAAFGLDVDDVAAAVAAPGLGLGPDRRQLAERLLAAFTSGRLAELGQPDGLADLEEREHGDAFWSFAGAPLPGSHDDVLRTEDSAAFAPTRVGRKGRGAQAADGLTDVTIEFTGGVRAFVGETGQVRAAQAPRAAGAGADRLVDRGGALRQRVEGSKPKAAAAAPTGPQSRTVAKPAPRLFRPAPPLVGVTGVKPHHRHHGDGLYENGVLRCRFPGETVTDHEGVLAGRALVPTVGNGAVPDEVVLVVREAALMDGYHAQWLAQAAATDSRPVEVLLTRIVAEQVRLFGTSASYDGTGVGALREITGATGPRAARSGWAGARTDDQVEATSTAAELARHSLVKGTPPSPVAVTTWRQPWVPMFLEWEVRLDGTTDLAGWTLGSTDLEGAPDTGSPTASLTTRGRAPLHRGVSQALTTAMTDWLAAEQRRDLADPTTSELADPDEAALALLAQTLAPLDLASASLDGLREQLLGIRHDGLVIRDDTGNPVADADPVPLFGGRATVTALRVVDAFGRTRDVPLDTMRTTEPLDSGTPATVLLRPRVLHGARWLFRLVDPAHPVGSDPATAAEAWVDQVHPDAAVNPVAGFLLPDHIDEACEVFDRDGNPVGQLMHATTSDTVTWEPAPGRPLPPDAGPTAGLPAHAQHVGLLAAGLVQADVQARGGGAPTGPSALTTFLRAVDSTLWSVDTYSSLGSPTVAGLVGRPMAVVRATLRLELPDDLDEVSVTAPGGADGRRAVFAGLAAQRFPVRIGELGRADDSVLGFFLDDDYTRFHVVDKVVASLARESGRHTGFLGLLGGTNLPAVAPLDHPFLVLEDTLLLRPGDVRTVTLLMLPGGRAHLTSGIVPRKYLALADTWTAPGLRAMVPSLRVGPVLVDPAEIRLPKVASLGKDQVLTRRTGPLTWRDDPIVAASSAALMPPLPHEAQEGWIRVAPAPPPPPSGTP